MKLLATIKNPVIEPEIGFKPGSPLFAIPVFSQIISNFIILAFIIAAVVFMFMLLVGAIQYITAGGDKDRVGNASKRITSALIGLVILFSTYAVAKLVNLVFGIDVLHLEIPVIP